MTFMTPYAQIRITRANGDVALGLSAARRSAGRGPVDAGDLMVARGGWHLVGATRTSLPGARWRGRQENR
jgi:hypothetical protein